MIISPLNSIRHRPVNSDLPNYTNTFVADERFYNDNIFTFCQRFPNNVNETVQIKSDSDTVPTVIATHANKTTTVITATLVSSYDTDSDTVDDTFYFEYIVNMSLFATETFTTVTQDAETWKSEPFIGDSEVLIQITNREIYKLEYYNVDNAFQIDFSTGITFEVYIESAFKKYNPKGEKSTYDNQREITILKSTKQLTLELKTLEIPRYMAELIDLITGVDNLVINSEAWVYEEDSIETEEVEGSNFVTVSATLTNKEYLGINSSDIGFNCDVAPTEAVDMILTELNASGGVTFTVPAGYMIHSITSEWVSGTTVENKLGTTVGGNDLAAEFDITSVINYFPVAIHRVLDRDNDTDVYATVTGGVANLDIRIDQNKEL